MSEDRWQSDDLSLRELVRIFARHYRTVLVVMGLVVAGATAAAVLMTPVYRGSIVVAPADDPSPIGGLGGLASQLGGLARLGLGAADNRKEEGLAILQSRSFTESFISKHDLLPKLFPDSWDESKKQWAVPADEIPSPARGYKVFDRKVRSVSDDALTGLITISIDHPDRAVVADWANMLVEDLNEVIRRRAIDEAQRSLRYLDDELRATNTVELKTGISKLVEQQLNQRMLANVRHEYVFRVIDAAMTPDKKSFIRPQRLLMIVGGIAVGLVLGLFVALIQHALRPDEVAAARNLAHG